MVKRKDVQQVLANRIETEWYDQLVQDWRKLECGGIVFTKHAQGKRFLEDEAKFGKAQYGSRKVEKFAKEVGSSTREIYYVIQFARQYPKLCTTVQNSWWNIKQKLLPAKKHTDKARKKAQLTSQYDVEIRQGDFREVLSDIEPHSVKLILTDPPYGKEHLGLWTDLAKFADRVLGADGALVTYSGQLYLPEVLEALGKHLQWWWMCGIIHRGSGNLTPLGQPVRKVINQFKPLLVYVPKDSTGIDVVFRDLIDGTGPAKDKHNWQQPVEEAQIILKMFCEKGNLIVDPFAGSGAFGEAAKRLKMNFIGAEILKKD